MLTQFKRLMTEEKGQGMTEYALVLGIIAVAIGLVYALGLGQTIADKFNAVKTSLTNPS